MLKWLPKAQAKLTKFKTKANSNCDKDLAAINLTSASVDKLAATVPIEDASTANPSVYALLVTKQADFGVLHRDNPMTAYLLQYESVLAEFI